MNREHYYQKLRQEWENKIIQWRQSGKSGASWCRENGIKIDIFYYWSNKLSKLKTKQNEFRSQFIEIPKEPPCKYSGIELQYGNIFFRLDKDFDESCLCKILEILQRD